ncbi:hypothetical protein BUE80_DR011717 [Diplocarpon rosae]|nr:hypothetical protein BUE80_DR011717 [Diplocarpon rosae]
MGRELQKKKKRSSISKIKMKPKSKRVNPLGNAIIAANCKSSTTSKLAISNVIPKQFAPTSARVERDPETGKILRVIHDGKKANPLNDPLNDIEDAEMADDGEEFGGFDAGSGGEQKQATTDIVRRLEEQAAMVGEKRDRTQSEREREWIERLRRYNWVWYHPIAAGSQSFTDIMTDASGAVHRNTLPAGGMNPRAWENYKTIARLQMCAPFAEVVQKTSQPFVTAISDLACPRAVALGGKVLIAGEALNLVRPHMALSTTASAKQALLLEQVFRGALTLRDWETRVLHDGRLDALKTNAFGTFFLYGFLTAAGWVGKLLVAMVRGSLPFGALPEEPSGPAAQAAEGKGKAKTA